MIHGSPSGTTFLLNSAVRILFAFSSFPQNSSRYLTVSTSFTCFPETAIIEALYLRVVEIIFRKINFLMNRSAFAVCSSGVKNQRTNFSSFVSFIPDSAKKVLPLSVGENSILSTKSTHFFSENFFKNLKSFCSSILRSGL